MLRMHIPSQNQCMLVSDSDTESDDLSNYFSHAKVVPQKNDKGKSVDEGTTSQSVREWKEDLETLLRRAKMYQEYMKEIQIPTVRGSVIPFNTWQELAKSMKQLYKQPLHYLTNVQLKQWDKARINTEEEDVPMDNNIHPAKAEAIVWVVEEIHRCYTHHDFLARLWFSDPMYHAFVDPIYPKS